MKLNRLKFVPVFAVGCLAAWSISSITQGTVAAQEEEGSTKPVASSEDERFYMLNALWFKPDGGQEKYMEYMAVAGPFVAKYGGKSDAAYIPEASIIGTFDADLVFFVEWPNDTVFAEFLQDPGYQAVSHLREEAIRDSILIRCRKL